VATKFLVVTTEHLVATTKHLVAATKHLVVTTKHLVASIKRLVATTKANFVATAKTNLVATAKTNSVATNTQTWLPQKMVVTTKNVSCRNQNKSATKDKKVSTCCNKVIGCPKQALLSVLISIRAALWRYSSDAGYLPQVTPLETGV